MDGTICRQARRGWQSAGSKANREKSPAKASSIVNKKEHTRTDTKTKKKGWIQEYILFTPLKELDSNGM